MSVDTQIDCFIDTNILVYAYDHTGVHKHDIAAQLIRDCWENETGCLSIQVLQEFFVTITRKVPTPLDHPTARQIIADLGQWRVQTPEVNDILEAIHLQARFHLSFWDAMILQSATRLGCKQLLSEDLSDGQRYGDIRVVNPFNK